MASESNNIDASTADELGNVCVFLSMYYTFITYQVLKNISFPIIFRPFFFKFERKYELFI